MSNSAVSNEEAVRQTTFARAIEAVIWGMPVVNFDLMYQALVPHQGLLGVGVADPGPLLQSQHSCCPGS